MFRRALPRCHQLRRLNTAVVATTPACLARGNATGGNNNNNTTSNDDASDKDAANTIRNSDEGTQTADQPFCPQAYNNGGEPAPNTTAASTSADNASLTPERRYWLKTLLNAASTAFLSSDASADVASGGGKIPSTANAAPRANNSEDDDAILNDDTTPSPSSTEEAKIRAHQVLSRAHRHSVSGVSGYPGKTHRRNDAPTATATIGGGGVDAGAAAAAMVSAASDVAAGAGTSASGATTSIRDAALGAPMKGAGKDPCPMDQEVRSALSGSQPATSVEDLLAYNKKWSETIHKIDPNYFEDLARQQTPKFLWIGCADSRVPANQILGLAPGEVFVHRNVANVVSRSDLNCLSVVQFGIEHLRVEQLLVVGHYGCGGVTAAYKGLQLGLVDNWVSNVADIKYRNKEALMRVPLSQRVDALCELNAITQALNVAESNVVQAHWRVFREEQAEAAAMAFLHLGRDTSGKSSSASSSSSSSTTASQQKPAILRKQPLNIHGWCYGLKDGRVHPLVDFGPYDDVRAKTAEAIEAAIVRRAGDGVAVKKPLVAGI